MEGCLLDIAKNEVQSLVNLMKNEAQYLCCFNSYVENFDKKKEILAAKHHDVKRKFQKGKGVFSFKYEARQWECEADGIINVDTKMEEKCFFGWCTNCWWQYRRGKELAEKTRHVEELLGRCNSNIVAGRANISDIRYLSSQDFIHFKSREKEFQYLMKALQDGNCNMIGLQGMGGTGKTSMAKEASHKLKESKFIDKLIFLVVSKPPDFKKIRGDLAKDLDLKLEEVKDEELSSTILSKITNMDEKLLIILDDVWEKFDLTENLGIPSGHQHKKGCNLLITTRSSHVCKEMGCQTIELQTLTDEEALDLFLSHASISSSSHGLKGMPQKIVKHCRGVPVAILAIARALKNQDTSVWKDAWKILEDRSVDQNLEEAYKCLKLSYDHLKNEKAKELLLISSIFPEDYKISIPFLTEIGIGLGSFGANDKYSLQRSKVHEAIMELIYSFLLMNVEQECVKMHDLIREVALWIGDKDIKSLMNLKSPIKENLRYLFWQNDDFPDEFEANNLEVLLLFLDGSKNLNVSNTFFKEIMKLKVLVLVCNYKKRISALTLTNSLQPLKDVQTLTLDNLELGDISILGNLLTLVTLHFHDCSIIELPAEFLKLKKLGSLQVERCVIEKNNPFEVIERCSQLEELTFVYNKCAHEEKDAIYQNGSPLTLHRYYISFPKVRLDYFEECGPISRCFRIDKFCHLISDATLKQLVKGAEFLILEGKEALRIRKNHIHDIVAIDEGGMMNDLIVLHLRSCPNVECLIDTKDHDSVVTAFSNLTELHLFEMGIEDLCMGAPPPGFLEQLEIMELTECHKLKRTLPNGNFNLCHLKSMELEDCPKLTSVFQPSTARSLMQLEALTIRSCSALECIIAGEDGDSNQKNNYESLFPKLRMFHIEKCNKLRVILPILFAGGLASLETIIICDSQQLEYIFDELQEGEDAMFPSLKELKLFGVPSFIGIFKTHHQLMSSSVEKPSPPLSRHNSNNINQSPAARAFSWVQTCCSLNKSKPPSEETNSVSEQRSLDHTSQPKEQHSSNQNQNDELHFHLPALEAIYIANAPKINSICVKNYKMVLPSLQNVQIWHCSIKSFSGYNMVNWTTTEELDASTHGVSPFRTARSFLLESFKNVREIKLVNCWNIISLSTLSIEASTNSFENLTIKHCNNLKCITTHEGDAQVGKNYCSIFPRLETLEIEDCGKLEFLFLSTISGGLEKLKSLTIKRVPELKYVVGKYEKEQHSSNQNQNDELHFDLPILEILYMENAPKINSICSKNFIMVLPSLQNVQMWHCGIKSFIDYNMVNWTTTKESDVSIDGVPSFHATQSFLVQSLKNVREIKLVNCWNIISLSALSIETSTNSFENLTISHDHNLKCITTHEGNAQVGKNYCSIFPMLEILEIQYCGKLEFLFLSTTSGCLEKLKSLTIKHVPELKYVVGKYQKEQHSSNQNENDELHFNLPALETLYIENAPNINSICAKNYKMVLSSLQNVQMWHCGIKSVIDYDTVNWTTPEESDAYIDGVPSFHAAQSFSVQSLKNVRAIKLVNCWNIISLSTLSNEASTNSFENLTISHEHNLKCNTTHEGDAQVGQNYCSNFPRLEILEIEYCIKLEFLFLSAISGGLKKLKSLTIKRVPELKYVVGKYQKEQHSSNQNQNDELHFHLPALETLYIENAPKINSICTKNYKMVLPSLQNLQIKHCSIKSFSYYNMVNWTTTEELDASIDGVPPFHTAKRFLVQSLNNVRVIKLVNCWNIISLSTLSIEASTISFENLTFSHDHEGDAQVGQNYCSIFPRLEILEIEYCMKLEFLFLSAICGGLEKLKSLTIKHVPELKYVVAKYKKKQHSSNENQNDELHFDLPALETLHIENAPKIDSICAKNYKMVLSSLQNVKMWHCGIKSFSDYNMVNWTTIKELHASKNGAHLFHVAQSLLTQSLKNIRKIELANCANLILVSPLSIASTILLEELTIYGCDNLKYIVVDEEDARTRMNYNSIFPKLKQLQVSNCDALEYLFPAYTFRCHAYLESLRIDMTPKLKYVFGKNQYKDSLTHENQNIQTHIDFPALKDLSIRGVPELVNIYPENYYLRESSLKSIALVGFPELTMRPFNEFLVCWHTKLQVTKGIEMCDETLKSLVVGDSKMEVIFDLTYMDIEKNGDGLEPLASSIQELELQDLSEMVNICVGPKCIICFHSLQKLFISACKKLKVIFSTSTVRSLPMLKHLDISKCEELVHIVEEDYETNADDHLCHEPCFPNLEQVYIFDCDKLKYLFSITISDILPKLNYLRIDKAYEFKHVLIRQGEMKEMVVKDVLPQLRFLELTGLPNLVSICHGINFQILKAYHTEVFDCPNFSFYETSTTQLQEIADSQVEDKAEEKLSSHLSIEQSLHMGEATQQSLMKDDLASTKVKNEAIMTDPTAIGAENPTKKVPIHTNPNLNVLPATDNTHASAKIFEEEEEEQGGLITSRRPQSGMKASSSLSEEKLETSIDGNPSVSPITIISSERTFEAILPLSPMSSKASTSLNQTPSTILPKPSDGGSKNEDSEVWEGTEQKLSSHSNGRQALETPQSKIGSSNFTTDELVGKEVQEETIMMEAESQQESTGHDIQSHKEEEEEREGGLITMQHHQSDIEAKRSLLKEKPETSIHDDVQVPNESQALTIVPSGSDNLVPIMHPITSLEGVYNEGIKEASMVQNESKKNVMCHGEQAKPSNLTHEQKSSHSKGQIVESHDWTKSDIVEDTKFSLSPFSTPTEMMPSFLETNNKASIVPGVQKIVDMMKLEGFERSIFAKALETRPQLQLSIKDRSPRMLCTSYKVLLDILNILTTRTPLTITEADKKLLAEHLKDAYLLGFDKDWIESVKTKVFDCEICEDDSIQKVLKGLDNDLKINEAMLDAIHDEEIKAARAVEVAQQEHTNVMARHTHLLKARQDIIARRHQCWEIIAAKNRHFGF